MNSLTALQQQTSPQALAALRVAPAPDFGEYAYVWNKGNGYIAVCLVSEDDDEVLAIYVGCQDILPFVSDEDLQVLSEAAREVREATQCYEVAE